MHLNAAVSRRHGQRGVALIQAIVFIGFLTSVVAVVAGTLMARAQAVHHRIERLQGFYAAEAGAAAAVAGLRSGIAPGPALRGSIGRCEYDVRVVRQDETIVLNSTGICGRYRRSLAFETSAPEFHLRLLAE